MQVVLIKDFSNLGSKDDIITVKNGYARNYLIPQKIAIEANQSNLKQLTERLKIKEKKNAEMLSKLNQVIKSLQESKVVIGIKVGQSNKIFGRITTLQLSNAINEQKGYFIDKKIISIPTDIKEIGTYKAQIEFNKNNTIEIEFDVVDEDKDLK